MNNYHPLQRRGTRQRGAFAFLATLLLLVVVAFAIRMLLGSSQTTTYDTTTAGQSLQAYLAATSGQERAVALLKAALPNTNGLLDSSQCTSIGTLSPDPYVLPNGSSLTYGPPPLTPTPTPNGCTNNCTGCNVQVTGTSGSASRVLNLAVSFSSSAGVTGFGKTITERLVAPAPPSAAVFNLAYRRLMPTVGGGQSNVTLTTCNFCDEKWNIFSSSGSNAVGGEGVYASLTTSGIYTVTQTLNVARNYVEVGMLLSGANLGFIGRYFQDQGPNGKTTTGTASNTVTGQTTNGAVNDTDWCRGGPPPGSSTFADTLIFGFSGSSANANDSLTQVTFNCQDPTDLKQCANPVPLTQKQRFVSYAGDMYSEIWVAKNPDYTGTVVAPGGKVNDTEIPVNTPLATGVSALGAVKSGTGQFQPGTMMTRGSTSNKIALSKPLTTAVNAGSVVCGGTCAFFDHTTNSNTWFNINKSAGTTQWAAGFMCVTGMPSIVPILQGNATPVVWYEPF